MPNFAAMTAETVHILRELIMLDTSNPPAREIIAAEYLARVLRENGFDPLVIEPIPGRGNVVARIKGDGTAAPVLLYSHTDVVPVERDKWSVDPFGGIVKDDCVYGRGALDMKGITAMQLSVFLQLARELAAGERAPLKRDVIFAATADEETDKNEGIGLLVDSHPELLRAEYALSEFGGASTYINGRCFYPIQTAEKGTAWMRMIAHGRPGHASVPHNDNPVAHLGRAIDKLSRAKLPMHVSKTARAFVEGVGAALGPTTSAALSLWLEMGLGAGPQLLEHVLRSPQLAAEMRALMHNTAVPTGLRAGSVPNVIPSTAEAVIDCRTTPGCTSEDAMEEILRALGEDARHVTLQLDSASPPCEFDFDTPMFKTLCAAIKRHDPAGIPVPHMITGATDAKHVARLGTICYGFSPMRFGPGESFFELVHGHDERIAISALGWGVEVLYDVMAGFCGGDGAQ
jgi:acetylornithine deacetylase/succinyl-diaminopimelate desuccinylase-like protein